MRLLLIEDDLNLCKTLKLNLEQFGFVVDTANDGKTGAFLGMTESYVIAILDLGLPLLSGLEVLSHWRSAENCLPVIIISARDAWHEKVDGLKAGADDYLGKPFHFEELLARIQALLKRLGQQPHQQNLKHGSTILDEQRQSVIINGSQPIGLTAIEFRLLRYFMLNAGNLLTNQDLYCRAYIQR